MNDITITYSAKQYLTWKFWLELQHFPVMCSFLQTTHMKIDSSINFLTIILSLEIENKGIQVFMCKFIEQ